MMYAKVGIAGFYLILATGCAHVKIFETPRLETLRQINRRISDQYVVVLHGAGHRTRARHLEMGPDVTTWINLDTGRLQTIPTRSIQEIQAVDRMVGMIDGFGIGLALGASVGSISGYNGEVANQEERSARAAKGGFVGGMLMGGFGLAIGSAKGARQYYRFRWEKNPNDVALRKFVTY